MRRQNFANTLEPHCAHYLTLRRTGSLRAPSVLITEFNLLLIVGHGPALQKYLLNTVYITTEITQLADFGWGVTDPLKG